MGILTPAFVVIVHTARRIGLVAVVLSTLLHGLQGAAAEAVRRDPASTATTRITEQWAVRGVVIFGKARVAVLEYLPSGRQRLVEEGTSVTPTLAVVEIDADRVLLRTDEGPTTALRLGHGGQPRVIQPGTVARRPLWWRR